MGVRNNLDTIIVINKTNTKKVVDIVHKALLKNNFNIVNGYNSFFVLNELIEDSHLPEGYDIIREIIDENNDLDLLKSHKGGGAIKYENKHKYDVLVAFRSLNNKEIEAIVFYADSYFNETEDINNIIRDINNSGLEIMGITQGLQMLNDLEVETEIENILNGKINEDYRYIIN